MCRSLDSFFLSFERSYKPGLLTLAIFVKMKQLNFGFAVSLTTAPWNATASVSAYQRKKKHVHVLEIV